MPLYTYQCDECLNITDQSRAVSHRDAVEFCDCLGRLRRVFTTTVNILVSEHFRHNQRDFLPPKGDPSWDRIEMGSGSQSHAPPSPGEQLARELKNA